MAAGYSWRVIATERYSSHAAADGYRNFSSPGTGQAASYRRPALDRDPKRGEDKGLGVGRSRSSESIINLQSPEESRHERFTTPYNRINGSRTSLVGTPGIRISSMGIR